MAKKKKATKSKKSRKPARKTMSRKKTRKKASARASRATSRKQAPASQGRGGKGPSVATCPPNERIRISYRLGMIQVVPSEKHCNVNSNGVCWESDDYQYDVVFPHASPFSRGNNFPGIGHGNPKGSGSPRAGSNGPNPYKYEVIRVDTGERLDPTIKVDP